MKFEGQSSQEQNAAKLVNTTLSEVFLVNNTTKLVQ